jgi:hypothetical protein
VSYKHYPYYETIEILPNDSCSPHFTNSQSNATYSDFLFDSLLFFTFFETETAEEIFSLDLLFSKKSFQLEEGLIGFLGSLFFFYLGLLMT